MQLGEAQAGPHRAQQESHLDQMKKMTDLPSNELAQRYVNTSAWLPNWVWLISGQFGE